MTVRSITSSIAVLSMAAILAPPLGAQQSKREYSLTASLANPQIPAGEYGVLQLKAVGGEPDSVPRSIAVKGLTIRYNGHQFHQESTVRNGQVTMILNYTYYYKVEGSVPGEYEIPSVKVNIRGEEVQSSPVKFRIISSGVTPQINASSTKFARLSVPSKKLYVNQIFPIKASIYVAGHNSINAVSGAELKHESFVMKRFQEIDISTTEIQDRVFSVAKLPTSVFSLKAGRYQFGPASFSVKLYDSSNRFSMPTLFTRLKVETLRSDTVELEIHPLPGGAPASFTGGVGSFEMESSAEPRSLKTGDPITIKFSISGAGNFETMTAPVIPNLDSKAWKSYDPKKEIMKESDGEETGLVIFSQLLIPLQPVDEIPPFELTFFDPEHGQYITRKNMATPITVEPDNTSAAVQWSSPPAAGSAFPEAAAAASPLPSFSDVLHIRTGTPRWKVYQAASRPGILLGVANGVFGIVAVAFLFLNLRSVVQARREKRDSQPKKKSFKEAVKDVRPGCGRETFYHAAQQAFGLWEEENRGAPEDLRKVIAELKSKCETMLYGKASQKQSSRDRVSAKEAHEFIRVLKKLALKAK